MARRMTKKNDQPITTAQQLGSLIKSARDIMRKDKGLNGDLDRLPMLTWIMFLKFLDDMEMIREQEARLSGDKYRQAIEPPYRWQDWATREDGITGDELLAFVNQDEAVRPDGKRGAGLLAYLRGLQSANGQDRRDVIANVFRGVQNRMINGYLLRDVINKVNGIHFSSSEEIHTLSHLYETMLREMRDSAGDSGEFYTPRPVVKFMVEVINPQLGETVLDPACGTGGFLVEAYSHLEKQCNTVQDRRIVQEKSIFGQEAKPLPYMLSQMNLLLHGLEYPSIAYGNSLAAKIQEIGDRDRVDIIITNPPFGGEEEAGIKGNFPSDMQTSETALLFLQLIMRKIKRPKWNQGMPGRAAVVTPIGTLFGHGVCARIKQQLLTDYDLHTIIRLPLGVFAPYTGQETAILFFNRKGPTKEIWFYEHPLPPERAKLKNPCYTKSNPLVFEELEPLIKWWHKREENKFAWKLSAAEIVENSFNLDLHHPKHSGGIAIRRASEVLGSIRNSINTIHKREETLIDLAVNQYPELQDSTRYPLRSIEELDIQINPESRNPALVFPDKEFTYVDLSAASLNSFSGLKMLRGAEAPSRARRLIRQGDVLLATVRPYLCGHAVVPDYLDGQVCSTGFAVLRPNISVLDPMFLYFMLISPQAIAQFMEMMRGAHYPALNDSHIRSIKIPDCPKEVQLKIVARLAELNDFIIPIRSSIEAHITQLLENLSSIFSSFLSEAYGIRENLKDVKSAL
jgi:type I restriction enzyme M protein